jgi:hypothetical protein
MPASSKERYKIDYTNTDGYEHMPTRTIQKTVNDNEPVRAGLLNSDTFIAQATPAGRGRTTEREERIKAAYAKGADLDALTRNYHTSPAVLFKLLGLNPSEHADTYKQLLDEYNDIRARALR